MVEYNSITKELMIASEEGRYAPLGIDVLDFSTPSTQFADTSSGIHGPIYFIYSIHIIL